jgi:valyl-tRNA synthetase
MKMEKTYNPQDFEGRIYEDWCKNGYFTAKVDKRKEPFTMVLPPPNITGQLHLGHSLNSTIQDVIARFKRMQGYSTLFLPGTDHAAIATEVKIVEKLREEGLTKEQIGREAFLQRAAEWKNQYGGRIVEQLKKMGVSCDWTREAFTMDEQRSKAVKQVFVNLYNKGLIYRGHRIINWCPCCKTAISDAEVEYSEQASHLWNIRYPLVDGTGEIIVATTRPETLFGDTAVAVNPKDERYSSMVGKMLKLPLTDREIPIIADNYVEMDFGSGAVKITPAHDPNDFEVGLRHNLEVINVMNDDGTLNEFTGSKYNGLKGLEARELVCKDLQDQGYMVSIEDYSHNVGTCYRCHTTVEPRVSDQWFVKMEPLAKPTIKAVREKKTEFIPNRFSKIFFHWMCNVKDWNISRQLWYGHRIPVYYCQDCGETMVSMDTPCKCSKCSSTNIKQDEDVLDTWFSSALWPFATLGYPDDTEDLKYFYPNSLLVTAYDIIWFWVCRMLFSGIEHMGQVPFPEVLIHGIVRDAQGRKMSKSLGNGIDPIKIIDQYGADSLRYSLIQGISPGNDTRYIDEKTEAARNYINKIWNASRFVLMNTEGVKIKKMGTFQLNHSDKWILSKLNLTIRDVTKNLTKYELGMAAAKIYDFVWTDFCDWYIELSKTTLYGEDKEKKANTLSVLVYVLENILKLMHPFTPFVTEEIYQNLPTTKGTIMLQKWPEVNKKYTYSKERKEFEAVMDLIKAIRNMKQERNVAPSKKVSINLVNSQIKEKDIPYVQKLAGVDNVNFIENKDGLDKNVISIFGSYGEVVVALGELVDLAAEKARLQAELDLMKKEIARSQGMLNNPGFVNKAPKNLIEKEQEKLAANTDKYEKLKAQIESM